MRKTKRQRDKAFSRARAWSLLAVFVSLFLFLLGSAGEKLSIVSITLLTAAGFTLLAALAGLAKAYRAARILFIICGVLTLPFGLLFLVWATKAMKRANKALLP
jgi:hypothetical protein